MATSLPPFPPFDVDDDSTATGQRWSKWKKRFENFLLAMDITDETRKRALLLHYIGSPAFDIFETLTDTGEEKDYKKAMDWLTEHFTPQKNIEYETYLFRQARQRQPETLDQYATRLRQLASTCEFTDMDKELKSQLILSCASSRLRRRALREPSLTLKSLLDLGRAMEISERQATGIESNNNSIVDTAVLNQTHPTRPSPSQLPDSRASKTCGHCGNEYPHPQGQDTCPARGRQCRSCGKMNHFARCCRSRPSSLTSDNRRLPRPHMQHTSLPPALSPRQHSKCNIRQVGPSIPQPESSSSSDDEYLYSLHSVPTTNSCTIANLRDVDPPKTTVKIANVPLHMLIDSGASINVIDETAYHTITNHRHNKFNNNLALRPTSTKVYTYGGTKPLPVLGTFTTHVESKARFSPATIYVIKGSPGCLLSYKTATELQLISIIAHTSAPLAAAKSDPPPVTHLATEYSDLFEGVGKMKDFQVQLHIDPSVPPVTQPHRRIPFHLREKVEFELDKLERQGIIEPVDGPTPWVSPLVVTPKPKKPDEFAYASICVNLIVRFSASVT